MSNWHIEMECHCLASDKYVKVGLKKRWGWLIDDSVWWEAFICSNEYGVLFHFQDESVKQTAQLMYQTALMESGFMLSDPKDFASRIYNSVKTSLDISHDTAVEEEEDSEETEAAESQKEGDDNSASEDADAEPYAKDEL